jgi:hypothetical protein
MLFLVISAIRALYIQWLVIFSPQGSPLLFPRTSPQVSEVVLPNTTLYDIPPKVAIVAGRNIYWRHNHKHTNNESSAAAPPHY